MFLELGRGLYFTAQVIYVLATVLVSSLVHRALVKIKTSASLSRANLSDISDSFRLARQLAAATPAAGPNC